MQVTERRHEMRGRGCTPYPEGEGTNRVGAVKERVVGGIGQGHASEMQGCADKEVRLLPGPLFTRWMVMEHA